MDAHEARKQANAKVYETSARPQQVPALRRRLDRVLQAAQGNPGLQDLLFSVCLQDPDAGDRCLAAMESYYEHGILPHEEQARFFLEDLAIETLLDLLSGAERELLRASTLFEQPMPMPVMHALLQPPPEESSFERLTALGLWDVYEDSHRRVATARALNGLVRPKAGALRESESRRLAKCALPVLFACWGGENAKRTGLQDHELTRLGLIAGDAQTLRVSMVGALRYLQDRFEYRKAAHWAQEAKDILGAAGMKKAMPGILRLQGSALMDAAEYPEAEAALTLALALDEEFNGSDTRNLIPDLQNLATLYEACGKYTEAINCVKKALDIHDRLSDPEDLNFAKSLYGLALICGHESNTRRRSPM